MEAAIDLHGEMENQAYLVEDTSSEIAELQRERDELDQEVNRLTVKVGDLEKEKSTRTLQLQQARAEVEEARSLIPAGELPSASPALPEAADLLNQLKGVRPKTKAAIQDVEALLEMLS